MALNLVQRRLFDLASLWMSTLRLSRRVRKKVVQRTRTSSIVDPEGSTDRPYCCLCLFEYFFSGGGFHGVSENTESESFPINRCQRLVTTDNYANSAAISGSFPPVGAGLGPVDFNLIDVSRSESNVNIWTYPSSKRTRGWLWTVNISWCLLVTAHTITYQGQVVVLQGHYHVLLASASIIKQWLNHEFSAPAVSSLMLSWSVSNC